jgi:hypothetical protein
MIWVILVALVAGLGVLLLALGLRGRRINDHPHCRRCLFDLVGLLPADAEAFSLVCPECGRSIKHVRDIRFGARVRRRWMIAGGSAILVLVMAFGGSVVWFAARGPAIYAKLPTPILRTLIPYSSGTGLDAIGNELAKRITSGTLDLREVSSVVEAALDRQRDERQPWSPSLGGAIEAAIRAGQVSDAQFERFCAGAVRLHDYVRETIVEGDEVPIRLVVENRGGVGGVLRMQAHLLDVILDDVRIDGERNCAGGPVGSRWPGSGNTMIDYVLSPQDRSVLDQPGSHYPPARARVEPGAHTITTVWALIVGEDFSTTLTGVSWSVTHIPPPTGTPPERTLESIRSTAIARFTAKDSMSTWKNHWADTTAAKKDPLPRMHIELVRFKHPVTVVPKTVEPVELVSDPAAIAAAQGAVTATPWVQPAQPSWQPKARLHLSFTNNGSIPIAGRVYWLVNGEKILLGTTVMPPPTTGRTSAASFNLPTEPPVPETVELVIEPDPAAAHRSTDCLKILGSDVHVRVSIDEKSRKQLRGEGP